MGAIWFRRASLIGTLNEMVGYKSGVSLNTEQMVDIAVQHADQLVGEQDDAIRVRSEEFETLLATLLHGVGNITSASIAPLGGTLFHEVKEDPARLYVFMQLADMFSERLHALARPGEPYVGPPTLTKSVSFYDAVGRLTTLGQHLANPAVSDLDRRQFAADANEKYGPEGVRLAERLLTDFNSVIHRSPWLGYREFEFKDVVALDQLFRSESLTPSHGNYLDQRFVDYLYSNEAAVAAMNWRKFEGLIGEYFTRSGYRVELGAGRNDDGVDARVWSENQKPEDPATMVIQCKREKGTIGKVVVKALYADVVHEGAKSGLIVTTNRVSRGAKKTIQARSYPIQIAEGTTVRDWLRAMRTPGTSPFLGE